MIDPRVRGLEPKIVEYVNDQVRTLRDARSERETVWQDCIKAYLSEFDDAWVTKSKEEGRSARYLALTWDAVENVTSQLAGMLFPNEEWFSVEPGRSGGNLVVDDDLSQNVEILMRYQHRMMDFRAEYLKLLKWLVITGNCPWTMTWEVEKAVDYPSYSQAMTEWVQIQQQMFQEHQQQMVAHAILARQALMQGSPPPPPPEMAVPPRPVGDESIAFAGPKLTVGDPFSFIIDTAANDPRSAFRALTFWRSKAYLLSKSQPDESGYAVYENLDLIQNEDRKADEDMDNERLVADLFGVEVPTKKQVKLVECQGDFEIPQGSENELFKGYVATVANGRTLVRFEQSHLWSRDLTTQLATLISVPGQSYGTGLVEMALGSQDAINVRSNQMIDAVAVAINPETKVIDDGVFDPDRAESGPGAQHLVGTLDNLQPLIRDLSGLSLSFSEIGQMKAELQQLTRSANPFTTQHYKKSATEIARDTTVAGTSLQEIARSAEENSLVPILRMQLQYTQQYMAEDVALRVMQDGNPEWRMIGPQDVRNQWMVNVVGSQNMMLKEQRLRDLMMFFQLATGNPETSMYIKKRELMRQIYQELGFTDSDKIFVSDEELMMQQMQMMGGPGGQAGPGGGAPADQGDGGAGLPAGVPADVAAVAPFAQQAQHGLMGASQSMG